MAKISFNKKHVTLDSVRVSYDEKTDTIHLTAKDKDFISSDQFHITLNKDSKIEETLRKVLNKHGVITDDKVKSLPKRVDFSSRDSSKDAYSEIPLGVLRDGSELKWMVNESPHLFVYGSVGSGKSILERVLLKYTSSFKEEYEVYGVDFKAIEMSSYKEKGLLKDLTTDRQSTAELLSHLQKEQKMRYEAMEDSGVNHYTDLKDKPKGIIVVVDELTYLTEKVNTNGLSRIEALKENLHRENIIESLKSLSRLGRRSGIHLALFSRGLIDIELQEFLNNNPTTVVAGKVSKDDSNKLLKSELAFNTTRVPGRAVFMQHNEVGPFQMYHDMNPHK